MSGQAQIGDDHVGAVSKLEGILGGAGLFHFVTGGLQLQLDHAPEFLFVLDHQDGGLHWQLSLIFSRIGRKTRNTLPAPGSLSTVIWPPCSSTIFEHDRQAQSDAARFRGEERIENAFEIFGFDAGAAIDHADLHCIASRFAGELPRLHRYAAVRRTGLCRVQHQVVENALDQLAIQEAAAQCRASSFCKW